ncbi:MAG: glycosyltransferase [Porphyromonadaceae bacterium]|nr:glycosyltransferase [Porphyromonadaceae bacterium]
MNECPLLSVIIPAYNVEAYLDTCLSSLMAQTYRPMQIVIVNDGSTDSTLDVAERWAAEYPNIEVVSQENRGLSGARNTGLMRARGELVAFLDSDDTFEGEHLLEAAVRELERYPECDFVQFAIEYIYSQEGRRQLRFKGEHAPLYGQEALWTSWLPEGKDGISWTVWNKVYRRSFIDAFRFYPRLTYEDNFIVAQMLLNARGVCFSSVGAYGYLQRSGSITQSGYNVRHRRDMIFIYGEILRLIEPYAGLATVHRWVLRRLVCDAFDSFGKPGAAICRRMARAYLPRNMWAVTGLPLDIRTKIKAIAILGECF